MLLTHLETTCGSSDGISGAYHRWWLISIVDANCTAPPAPAVRTCEADFRPLNLTWQSRHQAMRAHTLYTHEDKKNIEGKTIKHVRFNEAWIMADSP